MPYRLRPGFAVIDRGPRGIQIGSDPNYSVILDDLDLPERRFLFALANRPNSAQIRIAQQQCGLSDEGRDRLLARLKHTEVLEEFIRFEPGALHPEQIACIRRDGHSDAFDLRAHRKIQVWGASALGTLVFELARRSNIGEVQLAPWLDTPEVSIQAPFPFPREFAGCQLERAIEHCYPEGQMPKGSAAREAAERSADLHVFISRGVFDPTTARLAGTSTYLPVVEHEMGLSIGPLVSPLGGPCFECLERHRRDQEVSWGDSFFTLNHQMLARESALSSVLLSLGAGQVLNFVLDYLDGRGMIPAGTSMYLPAYSPSPGIKRWRIHPQCQNHPK
ncbi:hypothetical protein BSR28_08425 [Boudabousia liubingyangii]|uniref:hypothetical protein n=1 Tax=Boudabousia liubingyangii TaxID=1921764 RepID=UPI00093AAEB4|nr:hypothetical protein [Boudabousia liubingyangii]OKL46077.1 hypothetical protein BSR28_08425 [Boudabousia liubingyangii]